MSAFRSFLALPDRAAATTPIGASAAYIRVAREERARAMSGILSGLFGALRSWNARRRTEAALRDLDDRILADIGLSREEIRQIARGHYLIETPSVTPPSVAPANAARVETRAA
jgi:uncharacterized protein YjiS (DUF1127 family)